MVEYALVIAFIAIIAVMLMRALGLRTTSTMDNVNTQMVQQGVAESAPTPPVP
jgi:Flp pilus assembly pilin Flp